MHDLFKCLRGAEMTFLRIGFGLAILIVLLVPLLILWLAPDRNIELTVSAIEPWIPVYESLIWPIFILFFVIFFTPQIKGIVEGIVDAVVRQGRSIEIPNFLKLGENLNSQQLATPYISANDLSVADLSMDNFVDKDSKRVLRRLQSHLKKGERFNVLVLSDRHKFSEALLREYVTSLGLRYVVFTTGKRNFDGWIPAGLFGAQLSTQPGSVMLTYDELKEKVAGIRYEKISPKTPVAAALKRMQTEKTDAFAIVEKNKFRAMLEQDAIVAGMMLDTYERAQGAAAT